MKHMNPTVAIGIMPINGVAIVGNVGIGNGGAG